MPAEDNFRLLDVSFCVLTRPHIIGTHVKSSSLVLKVAKEEAYTYSLSNPSPVNYQEAAAATISCHPS